MTGQHASWLPLPDHFEAGSVGEVWRVLYQERAAKAAAWAREHDIRPASRDRFRICLIAVDCQNTFCIPGFELFVAGASGKGAVEDNVRLCEFIYRNLAVITTIVLTMDTHTAIQVFHPIFLEDSHGRHPPPMTPISREDVAIGRWKVSGAVPPSIKEGKRAGLEDYLVHYCRRLEEGGKYQLMIWPYHAMLGGIGHALVAAVEEACFFHAIARYSPTHFEIKGNNPLTENYSVLRPEVLDGPDGRPIGHKNVPLIERILDYDMVIIGGQAKSHCVAWTLDDLLAEIRVRDERLARKVYLLEDCTSPVVVPGVVDFSDAADAAFRRFQAAGMHLVRSTEPIAAWPEVPLDWTEGGRMKDEG